MKFDMDVFIQQLGKAAHHYGSAANTPSGMMPAEDQTAARVLFAITDALKMATDDTERA